VSKNTNKIYSKLFSAYVKPLDVMVNILDTPCCKTVLVYIFVKRMKFKFLLKMGKTECVCVAECSSYAPC
jgi:phage gp36-like protein